jgi:hypothetical protein
MNPTESLSAAIPKETRLRLYTRLSHALRKRLRGFSKATGRSERAIIEEAVARYLANPAKDPSTFGALDRLVQAIDDDRRQREQQHRDIEILSEAFGRFVQAWAFVHGVTFSNPATPEAAAAESKRQAAGEALYKRFVVKVAGQFLRGHRFVHDLPGVPGSQEPPAGKP